jgi:hypothetical protein
MSRYFSPTIISLGQSSRNRLKNVYEKDPATKKSLKNTSAQLPAGLDAKGRKIIGQGIDGYKTSDDYAKNVMREFGIYKAMCDIMKYASMTGSNDIKNYIVTHFNYIADQIGKTFSMFEDLAMTRINAGEPIATAVNHAFDEIEFVLKDIVKSAEKKYPLRVLQESLEKVEIKLQ